jgi:hypothetical protein
MRSRAKLEKLTSNPEDAMATDPPYTVVIPPPPPRPAQVIALVTAFIAAILAFLGYNNAAGISATISFGAGLYDLFQAMKPRSAPKAKANRQG